MRTDPSLGTMTELGVDAAVGRTVEIPFAPMEDVVEGRLKAAQSDDAEVDLKHWAPPGETPEEAAARVVLRRFAVRWWKYYQTVVTN